MWINHGFEAVWMISKAIGKNSVNMCHKLVHVHVHVYIVCAYIHNAHVHSYSYICAIYMYMSLTKLSDHSGRSLIFVVCMNLDTFEAAVWTVINSQDRIANQSITCTCTVSGIINHYRITACRMVEKSTQYFWRLLCIHLQVCPGLNHLVW